MSELSSIEGVKVQRLLSPLAQKEHAEVSQLQVVSSPLRPRFFKDYPGQELVKANLIVYVEAAKKRQQPMDHVLLHGPPGLGKTTLASIIASELSAPFCHTSGPSIDRPGDLAGILAGLESGTLLFIDEIHRLSIQVEEVLYSAMEDFAIDLVVGQGPSARSVRMPLAPFTLVGATTRLSLLSRPFLNRFGIQERLEFYDPLSLQQIVLRTASILGVELTEEAAHRLACRSRGTPRIANRLLKRVIDFAAIALSSKIDEELVDFALKRLGIDPMGLDQTDRDILLVLHERYKGGPVGIEAIAISLGEDKATIEDVYEPFLVHQGFLVRTPRGRMLTDLGRSHLLL